jgi:hypothetical protein
MMYEVVAIVAQPRQIAELIIAVVMINVMDSQYTPIPCPT